VDTQALGPVLDGDPQKVEHLTQVLHRELLLERRDDVSHEVGERGHEDDVVDVEEEVRNIYVVAKDEQGDVRLGLDKAL
jgi:hypothetical protein